MPQRTVAATLALLAALTGYAQNETPEAQAQQPVVVILGARTKEAIAKKVEAAKRKIMGNPWGRGGWGQAASRSTVVTSPMVMSMSSRVLEARLHILLRDKSLEQAFEAYESKDYSRAADLFKTAYSKVGYEEAAVMLGKMYLYGQGVLKDGEQAIHWFEEVIHSSPGRWPERQKFNPQEPLAMTTRTEASFMLGRMYELGMGVPKDPAEEKHWYELCVELGYVPALSVLGQAELNGYTGKRNPLKALAYFKQAADAGYVPAFYHLGKLYYYGDDDIPSDPKQALAYFNTAAKAGHAGSLFAVGRMFELGKGIPADRAKAVVFYKEAALKGDSNAQYALGSYFYQGEIVPRDPVAARQLFEAAAKQGNQDAANALKLMAP